MNGYLVLKHLHVSCVVLSGTGFLLRGVLVLAGRPLPRFARWLPHVVDTALLASAVAMAVISRQYPFEQPWLTAKVLALAVYIVLGSIALKRGRTRSVRAGAFVAALLVFGYIVGVALTRNPYVW